MMIKPGDDFGDRMKSHEREETALQFDRTLPLYARIDGRGFSKFTKGMNRPFDARMSRAMIETTKVLVSQTHAKMGFVQSDEISLLWSLDDDRSQFLFDGKKQKIVSVLAGLATAAFTRAVLTTPGFEHYAERLPHFDARVFSLPSRVEAANAVLWREQDATKNAISMAAHHLYSHKSLQGLNSATKLDLIAEKGIVWDDYPAYFRRGTFVRRMARERLLTVEEWSAIPEANRPPIDTPIIRNAVEEIPMPPFRQVTNRVEVLFDGAEALIKEMDDAE